MKLMKQWLLVMTASVLLLAGCSQNASNTSKETSTTATTDTETKTETTTGNTESDSEATETDLLSGKHTAQITIKDYGTITVELDADAAPISVTNFVTLVNDGFYDGLSFHRIIDGFMMQGGDPLGTGMGGSEHTIKGEFSKNGVENPLTHTRGAISMARSQSYDSASSQFFIVHQDSPHLNGEYAVFGYVTEGMDVVDAICEGVPVEDANGSVASENRPIIESIVMLEN